MRTFLAVCLLVVGGWMMTLADMLLFFRVLPNIRPMLLGICVLAAAVWLLAGAWCMKARRLYAAGAALLVSAAVMWASAAGFAALNAHAHWRSYLPIDFNGSFGNLTLAFGCLIVQTLAGAALVWASRRD